jgi:hypothetical protein
MSTFQRPGSRVGHVAALHRLRLHAAHLGQIQPRLTPFRNDPSVSRQKNFPRWKLTLLLLLLNEKIKGFFTSSVLRIPVCACMYIGSIEIRVCSLNKKDELIISIKTADIPCKTRQLIMVYRSPSGRTTSFTYC